MVAPQQELALFVLVLRLSVDLHSLFEAFLQTL